MSSLRGVDEVVLNTMFEIADAMVHYMAGESVIPIDTHNLKDGLGVGVFYNGALRKFVMNPKASIPRTNIGMFPYTTGDVWGKDMIQDIMDMGVQKYGVGLHLVLYSSMPYDYVVDRQTGFFTMTLTNEFMGIVEEALSLYRKNAI